MKRLSLLVVAVCLLSVIAPDAAGALPHKRSKCHEVDASFTSEMTAEGCTSPLGLCATGTIRHDPLIKGPMVVTINDGAPSAGMPASEPASILSVSGERILTPRRGGTLTAHVIGIGVFGASLDMFGELNVITGGTGPFAGATGTISVFGRAMSATTCAGEMSGTVCLP